MNLNRGYGEAYFQYQGFEGELASYFNVATSDRGYPAIFTLTNTENGTKVQANLNEKNLLFSVVNFFGNGVTLSIDLASEASTNILVIVLGILGGVLLVGLIIAAVCIVKRSQEARVHSEGQLPSSEATKLSGDEI